MLNFTWTQQAAWLPASGLSNKASQQSASPSLTSQQQLVKDQPQVVKSGEGQANPACGVALSISQTNFPGASSSYVQGAT